MIIWQCRCTLKKGKTHIDKANIQRSKLVPIYEEALQRIKTFPRIVFQSLPPKLRDPQKASIGSIVYWLRSYKAAQEHILLPAEKTQMYFGNDGNLQLHHI